MLSKAFVFAFTFLCVFALLMGAIDSGFLDLQTNDASYRDQNSEVAHFFSLANITTYKYSLGYNFTTLPQELITGKGTYGLPSSQAISFQWGVYLPIGETVFYVKHLTDDWPFGFWWGKHDLKWYKSDGVTLVANDYLKRADLVSNYNTQSGASIFFVRCEAIRMNFALKPFNSSYTLFQSWDNGMIQWYANWGVDTNATGLNAWSVLGQLLTFQSPNLGIPGEGGRIASGAISAFVWSVVAIILVKITLGVIPFLSGGSGD